MEAYKDKKTNVILILTDDQGYWSLGCYGNREIRTPHIDRLAAEGIRFDNFFCTSPVCSPARASLLTGKIPSQHGVHDFLIEGKTLDETHDYLQGQRGYTEILAEEGYTCGISGKWHLGDSYHKQKGFSHWYVMEGGGAPYYAAPMVRHEEKKVETGYITDLITDDALSFIRENSHGDKPFYLSIHYNAPHGPWIDNHPKDVVDSYDGCTFVDCPDIGVHPWTTNALHEKRRENLKGYYAAVTEVDRNIGRLLKALEEQGLEEDTLIIFTSDNGFNCGHHGIWGKGNGTFPQNMFDTSVKVPFICYHPGHIHRHQATDALVSGYDFMPTLLDYLGINYVEDTGLPGRSFCHVLKGEEEIREPIVIYDEYGPVRMIRTKTHKYIHRFPYGPHELYDLVLDPEEEQNQVNNPLYEGMIESLRLKLFRWFQTYVDPTLDGARMSCTGQGQRYPVGIYSHGKEPFNMHKRAKNVYSQEDSGE